MELKDITKRAVEIRSLYSILEKEKYGREWTSLEIAQGFVGDVGDLMKLVMAKEGIRDIENIDEKLAHELSDCLWVILVLSEKYNIDIEKSFLENMKKLEEKINTSKA
jgi:NTP pyrophosphatase (non-canonical NTP hydrolase)